MAPELEPPFQQQSIVVMTFHRFADDIDKFLYFILFRYCMTEYFTNLIIIINYCIPTYPGLLSYLHDYFMILKIACLRHKLLRTCQRPVSGVAHRTPSVLGLATELRFRLWRCRSTRKGTSLYTCTIQFIYSMVRGLPPAGDSFGKYAALAFARPRVLTRRSSASADFSFRCVASELAR